MEHLIRVMNDRDRQALAWLRTRVGEVRLEAAARAMTRGDSKLYVSALCRYLAFIRRCSPAPDAPPVIRSATSIWLGCGHCSHNRPVPGRGDFRAYPSRAAADGRH